MNPRQLVTVAAEAALIALSVVVAIGLERLFVDTSFLAEVLVLVVGSHLVAIICRRAGLGMIATTLVSLAGLVLLTTALLYGDTASAFIPTSETLDLFRADLSAAWDIYAQESAPVDVAPGLVAASGILLWWLAFLADWAAFRLRSPLEAVAPATAVFVFTALLGVARHQIAHGALFAAGVIGVLLTMRAERQVREEVWVASGTARGVGATLRVGAAAGAFAVVLGAITGPALPGAGDPALIDVTDLDTGPDTRVVISPLVEVSTSLVDQPDVEVFSVEVDQDEKLYWRLMALTEFDGDIWRRSSNFDDVRQSVDSDVGDSVRRRTVAQRITTRNLGNIYLPAAYEVSSVGDTEGIELEYETATGALVVTDDDKRAAEAGFTYEIESAVPSFDADQLPASATDGLDGGFVEEHTQLPPPCGAGQTSADGCWPTSVTDEALRITSEATTDFQRAELLERYFLLPGNFTYDINVALSHDIDDIEEFLDIRTGYCEQFASTFAAMARSIGVPTRVAVGFTWGDWSESRGEYVVSGKHAHAWPEVHFAGVGWVRFDPTPGRASPGNITGLDEAQAGEGDEVNEGPQTTVTEPVTPTTRREDSLPPRGDTQDPDSDDSAPTDSLPDATSAATDGGGGGGFSRALLVAGITLLVLGAAATTIPLTRNLLRRRALARVAADPVGRGELAWDDAVDALRLIDIHHRPSETPIEFAARVAAGTRFEVGPVDELARRVTILRYGAGTDAVEMAVGAQRAAEEIRGVCQELAGPRRVFADAFDPRFVRPAT